MKRDLFFSVVIPTYNSEGFIDRTLNSVFEQDYANYEVIVSDDGSTDRTVEVVKGIFSHRSSSDTKILTNEHKGPGSARNKGIMSAKGEWVAFLDSDDIWRPKKLSTVARYISTSPSVDLWCHSEIVRLRHKTVTFDYRKWFNSSIDPFISLYLENALSTSAITVRMEHLKKAGLFDEGLSSAQDYDLWLRLSTAVQIGFIQDLLGEYVVRANSISSDPIRRLSCLLTISDKYIDILRTKTRFYLLYRFMFRSRAFLDAGIRLFKQGNRQEGIGYMLKGALHVPFPASKFAPILENLNRNN